MDFWKFVGSIAGALLLITSLAFGARALADKAMAHEDPAASVVKIDAPGIGHGTGFYIGNNQFITAAHVAQISDRFIVRGGVKVRWSVMAKVVWVDTERDVALLEVSDSTKLEYVPAAKMTCSLMDVPVGTHITSIGYPLSLGLTHTYGYVAGNHPQIIVGDLTIAPGNSGGPVFDDSGEVIGMSDAVPVVPRETTHKDKKTHKDTVVGTTDIPFPYAMLLSRAGICASIKEHTTTASK